MSLMSESATDLTSMLKMSPSFIVYSRLIHAINSIAVVSLVHIIVDEAVVVMALLLYFNLSPRHYSPNRQVRRTLRLTQRANAAVRVHVHRVTVRRW